MKAFVAYSLPDQSDYVFADIEAVNHASLTSESNQFVFKPFDSQCNTSLYFKLGKLKPSIPFTHKLETRSRNNMTSHEAYNLMFDQIYSAIERDLADKVVLSRIKKIVNEGNDIAELFRSLVKTYSQAFVYIINHPSCGTWIGVSPEIIIKKEKGEYLTQAIAGTLPNSAENKWTDKEKQEHQYIVQHLRESLDKIGCHYHIEDTEELAAGSIKHLKSNIKIDGNIDIKNLLNIIHPGPALNGYPIEQAIELIREIELHDRKYYCGIVGPIVASEVNLFANIRCMQCHLDSYDLFLGGGIVSGSTVNNEWEETEMKSETLSRFLVSPKSSNAFS